MATIRAPGRTISVGEACRKLNPQLFAKLDPETREIMYKYSVEEPAALKKRMRQDPKPLLNKLETEFRNVHEATTGHRLIPQAMRFRLANGLWYKPDFVQFSHDSMPVAFEVKGPYAYPGALEKLKMAATTYTQIRWVLVWKESGKWVHQEVLY